MAGLNATNSKKAQDLYNKIRYHRTKYGNKGIVFLTATPISNSIAETYTMQRYMDQDTLNHYDLLSFDAWSSVYGTITTTMEIGVAGGFKLRDRFSKFNNLPELIMMFRKFADVVNSDDVKELNLPTAKVEIITTEPNEEMVEFIENLVDRADAIQNKKVSMSEDNMLCIANDGRMLAVAPRLVGVDSKSPKVEKACEVISELYKENDKGTHLIFCDLGTPTGTTYNVYQEIKDGLIQHDVKECDIAFIHDASTNEKRKKLIEDFNEGIVRILIGSTAKMGEGTNFQKNIQSLTHLDVPWKPSSIEQ